MFSEIEQGDMREVLAGLEPQTFDSVVCDPPYELGFMSKSWDKRGVSFDPETWAAAYRVLKPGGYLLAFGGTRTWHRIAVAIEDAGFELRDSIAWMYASGFPKSLDVSKAIDKAAGAEREVVGKSARHVSGKAEQRTAGLNGSGTFAESVGMGGTITAPATDDAKRWAGYGTALKPAFEPIIVARKPLIGTVARNVLKHGTGALNIDATRIECSPADFEKLSAGVENIRARGGVMEGSWKNSSDLAGANPANPLGRWPANVVLDDHAAVELDAQSGNRKGMSGGGKHRKDYPGGMFGGIDCEHTARNDSGGASRFFFCAKSSGKERDAGLDHWPVLTGGQATDREDDTAGVNNPRAGAGRTGGRRNFHPTVKPIALMRWLVKLVTPTGGLILDPFCGSGTTGCAAALEGFGFVGIDLDETHCRLSRDRIAYWAKQAPASAAAVPNAESTAQSVDFSCAS